MSHMNYNSMANLLMRQAESQHEQLRREAEKTDPKKLAMIAEAVNRKEITRRQGRALVEALYPKKDDAPQPRPAAREVAWKTPALTHRIKGAPTIIRAAK